MLKLKKLSTAFQIIPSQGSNFLLDCKHFSALETYHKLLEKMQKVTGRGFVKEPSKLIGLTFIVEEPICKIFSHPSNFFRCDSNSWHSGFS